MSTARIDGNSNGALLDDGKILDTFGNAVEDLILAHTVRIPIAAETDDDEAVFFTHDGLVDVPAGD